MTSVEYFPPCRKIGKQILTVSGPFGETFIFLPPEQGQVAHPALSDPLLFSLVPESGKLRLSVDRVEGGATLRLTLVDTEAATIAGLAVAHLSSDGD